MVRVFFILLLIGTMILMNSKNIKNMVVDAIKKGNSNSYGDDVEVKERKAMKDFKKFKLVVSVVIVAIILGSALSGSIYKLDTKEDAAIERFGQNISIVRSSGLHFKIPFIDKVRKIDVEEIHSLDYGYRVTKQGSERSEAQYQDVKIESQVLTKGSYLVDLELVVKFNIDDIESYLYNVDDPVGTLMLIIESVTRKNTQNKNLDDALYNKDVLKDEIKPEIAKKINSYGLGFKLESVKIQNISLPSEVTAAYDNVNNARNEKEKMLEQAKRYRNENIPSARAEADKVKKEAEQYYDKIVNNAKGDVERFSQVYTKYSQNKDITMERLKIEIYESILSKSKNKWILNIDNGSTVKYLPLDPKTFQKEGN